MARRSQHTLEEIREMILNSAESIIAEEGYAALNTRRIVQKIGYSVGSIYMVFANMEDLIMHIKARTLDDIALQLQKASNPEPQASIEELAKIYLRYAMENFNRWNMIFNHRLQKDSGVYKWYQEKLDTLFLPVEKQFTKLPPVCSNSRKKKAARILWGGVHGICVMSISGCLDGDGIENLEKNMALFVKNYIKGWESSFEKISIA